MRLKKHINKIKLNQLNKLIMEFFNLGIMLRNIKIQARLISAFLILSLIPLSVTGFFAYRTSSNAIKTKIETSTRQLIDQLSTNLQNEMANYEKVSADMQMSTEVQDLSYFDSLEPLDQQVKFNNASQLLRKKSSTLKNLLSIGIILPGKKAVINDPASCTTNNQELLDALYEETIDSGGLPVWSVRKVSNSFNALVMTRKIIQKVQVE